MAIKKEVIAWIEDKLDTDHPDYTPQVMLKELKEHGCVGSCVNELIYYEDTKKFFERNKVEINILLVETCYDMDQLDDKEDPLCLEQTNQNQLAWYCFEVVASGIAAEFDNGWSLEQIKSSITFECND